MPLNARRGTIALLGIPPVQASSGKDEMIL